ncbi:unnamed protein product [Phyllotreta striolata]|uniref:Uncharacterized protein n=1 Tax=Phyllotreta striolata TaxID=444603 RepID=A0A9P0DX73_PHYSR|nr:unnamed protein product [Phyllotreta striolata]
MAEEEGHVYPPLIISLITEFFGTAELMFIGCMGCIVGYDNGPLMAATTFAMAVLIAIEMFGHYGPVHLNPGVTVGFIIMGHMPWKTMIMYFIGQFFGAFAGYGLLYLVTPYKQDLCLLTIRFDLGTVECFFNEFVCSALLMLVVLGATDPINKDITDSIPLKIAFALLGLIFALEPFTGAGLNAARAVPPCVFFNDYRQLWLYMVGPTLGMALAATLYRFVFDSNEKYSLHTFLINFKNRGD